MLKANWLLVIQLEAVGWKSKNDWLALVNIIAPNATERKGVAKPPVALYLLLKSIKPRTQPLGPSPSGRACSGAAAGLWIATVKLCLIERQTTLDGARRSVEVVSKNPIGHC